MHMHAGLKHAGRKYTQSSRVYPGSSANLSPILDEKMYQNSSNCLDQRVRDIKRADVSESTPSSVYSESGESEAV